MVVGLSLHATTMVSMARSAGPWTRARRFHMDMVPFLVPTVFLLVYGSQGNGPWLWIGCALAVIWAPSFSGDSSFGATVTGSRADPLLGISCADVERYHAPATPWLSVAPRRTDGS